MPLSSLDSRNFTEVVFGMDKKARIARARAGGKARGWEERKRALERYNMEPHFCRECAKPIEVGNRRVADVIRKKFCNNSCAARYNNITHPQRYDRGLDSVLPADAS